MEIHYCMGEYAGSELYGNANDKCGRCGMKEKKGGCCEDDHKFYKLEDSHKKAVNDIAFNFGEAIIVKEYPLYLWSLPLTAQRQIFHNNSPPSYIPPPARILHGVFRI